MQYLEDHGLVGVVGHADLEVAPGEGEARSPEGLQLRHVHNAWLLFWLGSMP